MVSEPWTHVTQMASSSLNTSNPATNGNPPLVSPPAINVTKLSKDNYHVWKAQLIPFFRGQGLFGYLDGTIPIPPKEVSMDETSSAISNPLYEHWQRQDAIIVAILFSTISKNVLIQVVSHNTSAAIWCALAKSFSSQSRARVIQLRTELVNTRKGAQSAHDFFMQVKCMTYELAIAGHALHCDEIISYLLSGLGYDYDSFVTTITARTDPITLEEVYALLLTTESCLQHHNSPIVQPTVHVATRQSSSSSYRGRNSYRGRDRNYREVSFYNGSNGRNTFHRDTMICQVCDKPDYSAKKCYHRFNVTYRDNAAKSSNVQGLMATTSSISVTDWHPDTGATHHLTNNMANLNLRVKTILVQIKSLLAMVQVCKFLKLVPLF